MLDIKFIRDNIDAVRANIKNRNMNAGNAANSGGSGNATDARNSGNATDAGSSGNAPGADPDRAVALHKERSVLVQELDALRQARKGHAKQMQAPMDAERRQALIAEGKALKEKIADKELLLSTIEAELRSALERIPNMAHPDAPIGTGEDHNVEISQQGSIPRFNFEARDHVELGTMLDILDFETATKVSGTKFYYLKNEAVYLELALLRYAMDRLRKEGFTLLTTPDIAREEMVAGTGFNPRGEESNIYSLEGGAGCLIGTAEITLGGYHAEESLKRSALPIKLAGLSHCFRREAGAAGQFSKGLYRVHQFSKLEMFVYSQPEQSEALLEELRRIEEGIFTDLGIPFRVVDTCTADLGAPAYRKYDLEAWMPGRGEHGDWGEITSTSNCTDYQARRLNIRLKNDSTTSTTGDGGSSGSGNNSGASGSSGFVHTLNGTAIALPRAIISILENFQNADGSVTMPAVLQPYLGFDRISPKTAPAASNPPGNRSGRSGRSGQSG